MCFLLLLILFGTAACAVPELGPVREFLKVDFDAFFGYKTVQDVPNWIHCVSVCARVSVVLMSCLQLFDPSCLFTGSQLSVQLLLF